MIPGVFSPRRTRRPRRRSDVSSSVLSVISVVNVLVFAGCGGEEAPAPREFAPRVDMSLSASKVKVGVPVELEFTIEHPAGTEVRFPAGDSGLGGLEVVDRSEVLTERLEPGVLVTERKIGLRGFRTGAYTLGPFKIRLIPTDADAWAKRRALKSPEAKLEIYSGVAKGSTLDDLRDAVGPFDLPPEPAGWGVVLGVALAALALAGAALALRFTLRRREEHRRSPPPPPAHEVALAELKEIRESGLLEEGRVSEYTDRVSDVLRRYLEARYALPAPERTTEEFLDEVARAPVLDRARKRFLADYLAQCDLVKFAAADPGRRELEGLFESSVKFVEETAASGAVASTVDRA